LTESRDRSPRDPTQAHGRSTLGAANGTRRGPLAIVRDWLLDLGRGGYRAPMRITTDLGDWSTVPRRYQLALVCIVLTGLVAAIAALLGAVSLFEGIVLATNVGIALQWVFTRRRPWWRGESVAAPDLIDQNFGAKLAVVIAVDAIILLLALAGVFTERPGGG
jgi:hypothetical protein